MLKSIDDLVSPERIHSTESRKYYATVSQIAELSENDLRWLADHLGHDISVHREYYRLKDSTVELANKFAGKKLNEISVKDDLFSNSTLE